MLRFVGSLDRTRVTEMRCERLSTAPPIIMIIITIIIMIIIMIMMIIMIIIMIMIMIMIIIITINFAKKRRKTMTRIAGTPQQHSQLQRVLLSRGTDCFLIKLCCNVLVC